MSVAPHSRMQFRLCPGTLCIAKGVLDVKTALENELTRKNLIHEVQIVMSDCSGFCPQGPVMEAYPEGVFYGPLTPEHAPIIVEEHVLNGRVVKELVAGDGTAKVRVPLVRDTGFFGGQRLIVLRNRGLIAAENIDHYIARDGYAALARAVREMTSDQVIEELKTSGLRGRGGAGVPTGLKWLACREFDEYPKYVICNGDEGDPGAFMDRAVMEGDPHSVLEGMAIAAYAVGAEQGYIYVRAEYPLAIERLQKATDDARDYGLLGQDILGSGFNFDIKIYPGAGAFVCGEETALISSIQGLRGMPRPRPPFPVELSLIHI